MSGAKALLTEMRDLLREQVAHVVKGDHQALLDGAARHEQLLAELSRAEVDASQEELQAIYAEIEAEKTKLQSLISAEAARVDFLLRILRGTGMERGAGYPGMSGTEGARMLNRRA